MSELSEREKAIAEAALASPHEIHIGGRTFVIKPLDTPDYPYLKRAMRRIFMGDSTDPLDDVNERIAKAERDKRPLSPTAIKAMTEAAMAASNSKAKRPEPSLEQLMQQLEEPEGVRWHMHFKLHRADPTITQEWVNKHVTEENYLDWFNRLNEIEGLSKLDPKGHTSATG